MCILWIFDHVYSLFSVNGQLVITDAGDCLCPGNNLTLNCTANGVRNSMAGSISWSGSAFNCTSQENEIILLHAQAGSSGTHTCNNEAIVGWSLSPLNNETFISMLKVLMSSALIGKSITCYQDDGEQKQILGSYSIPGTTTTTINIQYYYDYYDLELHLLALDPTVSININYTPTSSNFLKFNWSVSASNYSDCPLDSLTYKINASNCGICPNTTDHTTVTCNCTGNAGVCMFTVKFAICERDFQDTITVNVQSSKGSKYYCYIL